MIERGLEPAKALLAKKIIDLARTWKPSLAPRSRRGDALMF